MSRLIGYARVSRNEQDLALQLRALNEIGCDPKLIFTDKISGAKAERPGMNMCLKELRAGDTLVVWRLDRLGRSMAHLVNLVESLRQQQVGFKSICDGAIDTTIASGELMFNIFSSLAQFERKLIQERTNAGLEAARARGRKGGRPKTPATNPKVVAAKEMYGRKNVSVKDICGFIDI
jgi:DNA invertase Pin-like site-specific DNA recombinase